MAVMLVRGNRWRVVMSGHVHSWDGGGGREIWTPDGSSVEMIEIASRW